MDIMISLLIKKVTCGRFWWGNYLWNQFQWLECDLITSHSIGRWVGSDLDYTVNASWVRKEGSFPTTGPLKDVGSLLVSILVERED